MGWFDFLKPKSPPKRPSVRSTSSDSIDAFLAAPVSAFGSDQADHLGLAAEAKEEALKAVKEKRFDEAWKLFHIQKDHYLKHASKCQFTASQTLALDASVHENMANALRLENRHAEALIHIIYCGCATGASKVVQKKVYVYFDRAKLSKTDLAEFDSFITFIKSNLDFRLIQERVEEWRNRV